MSGADAPGRSSGPDEAGTNAALRSPSLSLPKGGGAIRGIGEKFGVDPTTGTGSISFPIALSPGRDGFGPQFALHYDSGSGNGSFGLGWSLALPSITRKTDKGLPLYRDAADSDVYILSGAEDLVPLPIGGDGDPNFSVRRYRPRIDSLFARIERWTARSTGEIHWRSISRDNTTTLYGTSPASRMADPSSDNRIFQWLIDQSFDDKGNAVLYEYAPEDSVNLELDSLNERHRSAAGRGAQRYLKRVRYGNRTPNRDPATWTAADAAKLADGDWMFEVVFDYGEGHFAADPPDPDGRVFVMASPDPAPGSAGWMPRADPFSSYRAGFEQRSYRLCARILMFHHFPNELGIDACLVGSTALTYFPNPVATYLVGVTQSGFVRQPSATVTNRYLMRSMPPLEFDYSLVPSAAALAARPVREVPPGSPDHVPDGVDARLYQWLDLDGEGMPGIFSEQSAGWYFKHNRSANHRVDDGGGASHIAARFGPLRPVGIRPAASTRGDMRFEDLDGDGQLDLVRLEGAARGYHERAEDGSWGVFHAFANCPAVILSDPQLRMVDLTGDGHKDILLTDGDRLRWYPSLVEGGFGAPFTTDPPADAEAGPRLVFADGENAIYLADMSGDGLSSDWVRVRNGNVSYWPSLGYGAFGAEVAMDGAPWFDAPDRFDQRRIRLADIDGSGTTDLVYLHPDGPRLYANQAGNSWAPAVALTQFPGVADPESLEVLDLLGTGTAALVWSSPLPASRQRAIRYIALMDEKPHLLVGIRNNLGARTRIAYAPSTKFYLDDLEAGIPWLTRLPFPVHAVERVEHVDLIAGNVFTTRNAYHHGFFDGVEREFRGFSMVEQWDSEAIGGLAGAAPTPATNRDPASDVPPVLTRSWYHTGVYMGLDRLLESLAGLRGGTNTQAYFREPGLSDADFRALLLPETTLPAGMTADEAREACRALKGSLLRQEVYGLDGSAVASVPYTVAEHNFALTLLQPLGSNRHAIFRVDPAESLTCNHERQASDPRVQHSLALAVDAFGNVLQSASVSYARRQADPALAADDQAVQARTLVTYTVALPTNAIDLADDYRTPLPATSITYELTGYAPSGPAGRFQAADLIDNGVMLSDGEIAYEGSPTGGRQRRPIEALRTLYRSDDLSADLPLGTVETLAIPAETYRLALTPGLVTGVFVRDRTTLLPDPASLLDAPGGGAGGYVDLDGNGCHWLPSGRRSLSPGSADAAAAERAYAQAHFFLPCRFRTPFHNAAVSTESFVTYDAHDLLILETRDPVGNRVTAGQRKADDSIDPAVPGNDYRVLHPCLLSDPNRNRQAIAFDALGLVTATAVLGKPEESLGDTLDGLDPDPTDAVVQAQLANPTAAPQTLLGGATTRFIYDLAAFQQAAQPPVAHLLTRETHVSDLVAGALSVVQMGFTYSDGFGRAIQTKGLAPAGPAPKRDANGAIVIGPDGQPVLTNASIDPRWICSGWTIFNNKGKPVRQYEPFFTDTQAFELGVIVGVSPILFYDPIDRVIATLHPNDTYEKIVLDAWSQTSWDVNDTVLSDPRTDPDVAGLTAGYFAALPQSPAAQAWLTWYDRRQSAAADPREQDAASKAAAHANTPAVAQFDTLGRPFLTLADNGPDPANPNQHLLFASRIELDIEGNQRAVRDALVSPAAPLGRVVMQYDYDMLGHRVHQLSMEAGARWTLNDVAGKTIRTWDNRQHTTRTEYDPLRRPVRIFVTGADPTNPAREVLTERLVYGEQNPTDAALNLRGNSYLHFDQAGLASTDVVDFKGNSLSASRRVALDYKQVIDWRAVDAVVPVGAGAKLDPVALEGAAAPLMDADAYVADTAYDALNRPTMVTSPHTPAMSANQIRHGYDVANHLRTVEANLRGASAGGQPVWTPFVTDIDYDAKGRRQSVAYGNGATTTYGYDPLTLRLATLVTSRSAAAFPGDAPQPPMAGWPGSQLQNLAYFYDPAGNITQIADSAQQTIYFRNKRVEPSNAYIYDALYRLIAATGREHLGQVGGAPVPSSYNDAPRVGIDWSQNDGKAMGTYAERYVYDAVGNFQQMIHQGNDPANPGWTRTYAYQEPSQIDTTVVNNRLSATSLDGGTTWDRFSTGGDGYDAHGNMLRMAHLPTMAWDYRDQLRNVDLVGGGDAWYVYDASGERLRKVWEKSPTLIEERIYLGGFEIYRSHPGPVGVGTASLERETLHVMDDKQRLTMVETRTVDTIGADKAPAELIRYQFGNHLRSATLELDNQSQIISYEEYASYGGTTYQAVVGLRVGSKRYRYTGKERDDESGFSYHGARYFASWLGRWTSTDPEGLIDGLNLFVFGGLNPLSKVDRNGLQTTDAQVPTFTNFGKRASVPIAAYDGSQVQLPTRRELADQASADFARNARPGYQVLFKQREVGERLYREVTGSGVLPSGQVVGWVTSAVPGKVRGFIQNYGGAQIVENAKGVPLDDIRSESGLVTPLISPIDLAIIGGTVVARIAVTASESALFAGSATVGEEAAVSGPQLLSPPGFVDLGEFTRLNVADPATGLLRPGEASAAAELQQVLGGRLERITGPSGADFVFLHGPQSGRTVDFLLTPSTDLQVAKINQFFPKNAEGFSETLTSHLGKADIVPIDSRFLTPANQETLMSIILKQSAANQNRIIILR